jgi:isoquinoline 1-oxidoreductase alpha subunit
MVSPTVNGRKHALDIEPETPLLWVLRDELGLTSTKFGCGIAQCGAFSVPMNGAVTRSGLTPVGTIDGALLLKIEGLSHDATHPVQCAWIELDVPQCD